MRRLLCLTILVLFGAASAPAAAQTQSRPVSTKFDEYGAVGSCDHGARLDNFAIQLQNQPGSTAYIFAYAPEESGRSFLEIAKGYLVFSRGIAPDRITTVYGGRNDVLSQPRIQLWISPPGASRPRPQKFKPKLETFRGLFAENEGYDSDPHEPLTGEESDQLKSPVFEGEMDGPGISYVTHESLAEVLKEQKTAVAYIVAYNGDESAPGAWRRIAQQDFQLLKDRGLEASRLKIIYGGNKTKPTVQLWVAPADAPPPVTDAGPEQMPGKNVSLSWLSDSDLGYTGVERTAFKRMVAALQQFPTLRACVVVTFGTYEETLEAQQPPIVKEEPSETDQSTAAEQNTEPGPEPEPADVAKLVENWKDELAAKYKIGADRFIVLFSRTDGFSNNMMETWLVPPGAALPTPEEEPAPENPSTSDEEEIRKVLASFIEAWNKHDAKAFSMVFAEDADFTNVRGTSAHGRAEVEKFHAPLFATRFKDTNQKMTNIKIRFIKPDVAAVDAWWEMTGVKDPDGQDIALRKGLLNFIMTKEGDKWLITVMHNMDLPVSP